MKNVFALLTLLALVGCNRSTMTSPSGGFDASADLAPTSSVPSGNGDNVAPVSADVPQTQCELINITARRVLNVQPGSVTLRVNASYQGPGTLYVRLIDAVSGESYGDFPVGDITLPLSAGDYTIRVFVEVLNDGRVIQCDGSVSFTVPAPPTRVPGPPPEPTCDEEPYYVVDVKAWTEEILVKAAYDEEVCEPGEPVTTGFVYKLTEYNAFGARKHACEMGLGWPGPKGKFLLSECIPGNGAVDACAFGEQPDSDDFTKKWHNSHSVKVRFRAVPECNITEPGEPICETVHHPAVYDYIEHPEEGHLVDPCDEGQEQ